jgi:hypothetical protein
MRTFAIITTLIFLQGCASSGNPNGVYDFWQGVAKSHDTLNQQHYDHIKREQEVYIRARQGALPMRQPAMYQPQGSQQYPISPLNQMLQINQNARDAWYPQR